MSPRSIMKLGFCAVVCFGLTACEDPGAGAFVGASAGGLVGNQITGGSFGGTVAGAAIGGLVGAEASRQRAANN